MAEKLRQEISEAAQDNKKDIVQMIKEFTFRSRPKEDAEGLLPTLPNLYGLDIRFRYAENQMQEEKERRKIASVKPKSKALQAD